MWILGYESYMGVKNLTYKVSYTQIYDKSCIIFYN